MENLIRLKFKNEDDFFRIHCYKCHPSIKDRDKLRATKITLERKENKNYHLINENSQDLSNHPFIKDTFKDLLNSSSIGFRHAKIFIYDQNLNNSGKFKLNQEVIDQYFIERNGELIVSFNGKPLEQEPIYLSKSNNAPDLSSNNDANVKCLSFDTEDELESDDNLNSTIIYTYPKKKRKLETDVNNEFDLSIRPILNLEKMKIDVKLTGDFESDLPILSKSLNKFKLFSKLKNLNGTYSHLSSLTFISKLENIIRENYGLPGLELLVPNFHFFYWRRILRVVLRIY